MNKNKGARYYLILITACFIVSCVRSPTPPPTSTAKAESNFQPINPILLTLNQDSEEEIVNFYCYESQDCYESVPALPDMQWLFGADLDQDGNLLMPFRMRFQDKVNSVGFMVASKTDHKFITAPIAGFGPNDELSAMIFSQGKMIFAFGFGDDLRRVYILDQSGGIKEVEIQIYASFKAEDFQPADIRLGKGENGNIIAFNTVTVKKDGNSFVIANFIDLQSYQVETRLISAPEEIRDPPEKYNIHIDGILGDGQVLSYQYFDKSAKPHLGLFDTRAKRDKKQQPFECNGFGYFTEYKGFLYRSGVASSEGGGGQGYILDISDFHSLMDFRKAAYIVPFGDSFLAGSGGKVLQLDFSGKILQEFPIPLQMKGIDYRIVRFEN